MPITFIIYLIIFIPLLIAISLILKKYFSQSIPQGLMVLLAFIVMQFVPFPRAEYGICFDNCTYSHPSISLGYPIGYIKLFALKTHTPSYVTPDRYTLIDNPGFNSFGAFANMEIALPFILFSYAMFWYMIKKKKKKRLQKKLH